MTTDLWVAIPRWLRLTLAAIAITLGAGLALFLFMSTYALMYAVFG
jgi:hypothetical protein